MSALAVAPATGTAGGVVSSPGEWKRAAALGMIVAAVVILANSRGQVYKMTLSDGLISRYVAANMNEDPGDVHPVVTRRGTSLRYGRIGLSLFIWLFSAGRAPAMAYVQPVIMLLCAGAVAAAVATLFPRAPPAFLLAPFISLGFLLSVVGGFQDALAIAFSLWAVVSASRKRWWWTAALLACAMLTRENAGAVLIGIGLWCVLHRRFRVLPILASSLVPVVAWHAYVAARYGHWPLLDPYLRVKTSTIQAPFVAVWHSLTRSPFDATVVVVAHVVLAVLAFALWRRSLLGAVAAAAGLQVLMAGPFAYKFLGEATRAFAPLQVFVILALLAIAVQRKAARDAAA